MIQPIVEGHGEVEAVPVMLRRLLSEGGVHDLSVGAPIRQRRSRLAQRDGLQRALQIAIRKPNCTSILVIVDSDDDCPCDLAFRMLAWGREVTGDLPVFVAIAHREYEAWFLAGIEGLRGLRGIRVDAEPQADPEGVRDAKGTLERLMPDDASYGETTDQAAFSQRFDLRAAFGRSRSFRHLVAVIERCAHAAGRTLEPWPPPAWSVRPQ